MHFTSIYTHPWFVAQLPFPSTINTAPEHELNSGILNQTVAIGAVIVVSLVFAVLYFLRRNRPVGAKNPRQLFNDLCRAHHLSGGERTQIRNLASRLKILNPAILFLDHSLWDFDQLAQGEHPLAERDIENLKKLNRTLFVSPKGKPTKLSLT